MKAQKNQAGVVIGVCIFLSAVVACSAEDKANNQANYIPDAAYQQSNTGGQQEIQNPPTATGGTVAAQTGGTPITSNQGGTGSGGTGSPADERVPVIDAGTSDGNTAASGGTQQTNPPPDPLDPVDPLEPPGPDDGDPNQPIIEVPGVACGTNAGMFGVSLTKVQIGGREVHVAYPCNKHVGAPVTFILNLHGTMPTEEQKLYQVMYCSLHNHVDTHNFITAAPKAIGSQWGRSDNGLDEPHLLEVIDWVYTTFSDFDIRAMWVGGHSWGAAYTASFGCNPAIADRVKGLILMSGGGIGGFGGPSCSDRVSAIVTTAEGDGRQPSDQTSIATSHGCDAAQHETILNNEYTVWPNCDPHYVHANFYMLGKEHATFMDAEVVLRIADLIKQSRP